MKVPSTKRASTFFLRAVIVLIGIGALALCVFAVPNIWNGAAQEWPQITGVLYPGLLGISATIIPFLFALYQTLKLLRYIDTNTAFSESSILALKHIKYSAIAMSILYMTAMPLAFAVAQADDAPGLVLFSFAFACSPLVVATFAAVLQKLVRSAVDLKTENDLTV